MPLTTTAELLREAARRRTGLGAFNVVTLEYAEAIVTGAEAADRPVILQLSENAARFHAGRLRPIAAAMRELAAASSVPVSLHLDHVEDTDLLHAAADAGFSSVMVDAGRLPYEENVAATREAADWAHAHGLSVEAELGYVGGKETQVASAHDAGVRSEPTQAAEFVAATGVDALSVAVGISHAMQERTARLDDELIAALYAAVPVPLVLHGSSGVAEAELASAVAAGMTKVNVGTILGTAYTRTVRELLDGSPELTDPRAYIAPARTAVAEVVTGFLRVVAP